MDDPLLVEVQSEDYWYEGYNMRTGARGIFPAYYAIEVTKDTESYKGTDTATIINDRRLTGTTVMRSGTRCLSQVPFASLKCQL